MVLTAAGEGVQGWILFTVAAGWCPGTACCSVSGPRGVAATTTVTARLLAGTGCCSVWPGRLQCLCSLQHRHALHYTVATSRVHPTLTNKYISQTVDYYLAVYPNLRFFIGKSLTHSLIAKMISKLQMSQQFLIIMLSLPRHLTVQLGPYLLSVPGPPGRHMVCRARKYVRKKFANPRKNKKFLFRISVNCVGYPRSQMKTIATSAH